MALRTRIEADPRPKVSREDGRMIGAFKRHGFSDLFAFNGVAFRHGGGVHVAAGPEQITGQRVLRALGKTVAKGRLLLGVKGNESYLLDTKNNLSQRVSGITLFSGKGAQAVWLRKIPAFDVRGHYASDRYMQYHSLHGIVNVLPKSLRSELVKFEDGARSSTVTSGIVRVLTEKIGGA